MTAIKERPVPNSDINSREYLDSLRHSCAHVMAQAVQELFPGTKITIGPAIESGFYYDFDSEHHFTVEDLAKIEKRMRQIAEGNHAFKGEVQTYEGSATYWKGRNETYKLELLDGIKERGETITHYTHDTFTDLCRGGHLESTKAIRHFKLLSVAGAYWRGDEKRPMLQRIYGTAFPSKDGLDAYLKQMEEAKKRDHRKLGTELDLFSIHEEVGAGLVHWHPKGALVRYQLEQFLRKLLDRDGYQFVYTPHIASEELYKISGHLQNYADLMYAPMEIENQPFRAKPMNCPNHVMIYRSRLHSYRDLPIRFAEFGTVYRFEKSGVLHGLLRVRGFTQDDAHLFCRLDQIREEMVKLISLVRDVYKACGFEQVKCYLATRPEKAMGEDALWKSAEGQIREVLETHAKALGFDFEIDEGGGAFYGPKIDIKIKDAIGREWQLGTIQLDFNLPRRFDAKYRNAEGGEDFVVMIHRAIFGSFERFFGILVEHFAGVFPLWLAPVQVKILTINDEMEPHAKELFAALKDGGLRPDLDASSDKIGNKIRNATLEKVPYMVVLGPKDVAAGTLSVRLHDGRQVAGITRDALIDKLQQEARTMSLSPVITPS
ncbi:MAG: threonine--tRNA ligase [Elusimicrobia bacterium]|nr:threonine--tRNA ligase [Elusimicrobiota bacterium]